MIARPLNRFKPIPFSSALSESSGRAPVQWAPLPTLALRLEVGEPPRGRPDNPWGTALSQLTNSASGQNSSNDASVGKGDKCATAAPISTPKAAPKAAPKRSAMARYDGPHSLSIRSATSGRHYRFEQPGDTLVIDAIDIALMRRIEDITLL
jgi:hypothetical protein